uniref:THO complex subunit 2 n=1 Tax=Arcella intermedia TaxID=1963864 RepID=A0A6B2KWN0_9EUKA
MYPLLEDYVQGKTTVDIILSNLPRKDDDKLKEMISVLVDMIWVFNVQFQDVTVKLANLLIKLQDSGMVTRKLLVERLPRELLTVDSAKIIRCSDKELLNRTIQINTNHFMKQQKFNLLREESEGYSKLIAELNCGVNEASLTHLLEVVHSLIGYFELDPNRVFDIILDAFEYNLEEKAFLKLIEPFQKSYLPHILGLKFQNHYSSGSTPSSLYKLTAILIKNNFLDVNLILPHLRPTDEESEKEYKEDLNKLPTGKMTSLLTSDKKEKKDVLKARRAQEVHTAQGNQKICLVEALLDAGDWNNAQICLKSVYWPICPGVYPPLANALCKRINYLITPLYTPIAPLALSPITVPNTECTVSYTDPPISSYSEIISVIFPICYHVGPYLHRDTLLFCKLTRLLAEYMKPQNVDGAVRTEVANFIGDLLLPALSMVSSNPALSIEVWDLLKYLPYSERFRVYGIWKNTTKYPVYTIIRNETANEVKKILSRLTANNVKSTGRQIARFTHTIPDVVFSKILGQVQSYVNIIPPVVDSLKYMTTLSFDVLGYCLLCYLADQGNSVQQDGYTVGAKLTNLAQFTGYLYKKHTNKIDIVPMIQYIHNQLLYENSNQLLVLKEIIETISGLFSSETLHDEELLNLNAGGVLLRNKTLEKQQNPDDQKQRSSARAADSLAKGLTTSKLVFPIYILAAQRRANILFELDDILHEKVLGEYYDRVHETLLLYSDFINYYILSDKSTSNSKPKFMYLSDLVEKHKIEPESAFHLLRNSLHMLYSDIFRGEFHTGSRRKLSEDTAKFAPKHISLEFYGLFWSLRLSDIYLPTTEYEKFASHTTDENMKKSIMTEYREQEAKHKRILSILNEDKNSWFPESVGNSKGSQIILESCILPRCLFSSADALFCGKFCTLLHNLNLSAFSYNIYLQKLADGLGGLLFSCSESESARFGRFLSCTLQETRKLKIASRSLESSLQKTVMAFLSSKSYIKIRNTVLVLSKLNGVYPTNLPCALEIEEIIYSIIATTTFNDVKTKADSYRCMLEKYKTSLPQNEPENDRTDYKETKGTPKLETRTSAPSRTSLSKIPSSVDRDRDSERERDKPRPDRMDPERTPNDRSEKPERMSEKSDRSVMPERVSDRYSERDNRNERYSERHERDRYERERGPTYSRSGVPSISQEKLNDNSSRKRERKDDIKTEEKETELPAKVPRTDNTLSPHPIETESAPSTSAVTKHTTRDAPISEEREKKRRRGEPRSGVEVSNSAASTEVSSTSSLSSTSTNTNPSSNNAPPPTPTTTTATVPTSTTPSTSTTSSTSPTSTPATATTATTSTTVTSTPATATIAASTQAAPTPSVIPTSSTASTPVIQASSTSSTSSTSVTQASSASPTSTVIDSTSNQDNSHQEEQLKRTLEERKNKEKTTLEAKDKPTSQQDSDKRRKELPENPKSRQDADSDAKRMRSARFGTPQPTPSAPASTKVPRRIPEIDKKVPKDDRRRKNN